MTLSKAWLLSLSIFFVYPSFAAELLVIGDSLSCGPFGQRLVTDLTQAGHRVDLYCAVSTAAVHWILGKNPSGQVCKTSSGNRPLTLCNGTGRVPKLSAILAHKPYQGVVLALGTNSLLSPVADSYYAMMAKQVAAHHLACNWIAPPHLRPDEARGFSSRRLTTMEGFLGPFYKSLAATVGSTCAVLDSRPATARGTAGGETVDGVHRTNSAGIYWADLVTPALFH